MDKFFLNVKNCFILILMACLCAFVGITTNAMLSNNSVFAETEYPLNSDWDIVLSINIENIETIEFIVSDSIPDGYSGSIELTTGIYASTKVLDSGLYGLVIWSEGTICAPTDSAQLFDGFSNVKSIVLDNFDTKNVEIMRFMFWYCSKLETIEFGEKFSTANVTDMSLMFADCSSLTDLNLEGFNTEKVELINGIFAGCSNLTSINLESFNTENVTNMNSMFYLCSELSEIIFGDYFKTTNVESMNRMFYGCKNLNTLDLSFFETSNVNDMQMMFYECSGLTSLNIGSFVTTSVTSMENMFYQCYGLNEIDLSSFDVKMIDDVNDLKIINVSNLKVFKSPKNTGENNIEITLPSINDAKWYDVSDSGFTQKTSHVLTGNSTEFRAGYEINYKDKGGAIFSGIHAVGYPKACLYGMDMELVTATKETFEFGGWYTYDDCTGDAVTTISKDDYGNVTLYAKWIPAPVDLDIAWFDKLVGITKEQVTNISFVNVSTNLDGYNTEIELGTSLYASTKDSGSGVDVVVWTDHEIKAPTSCNGLFRGFSNLQSISFENFYTSDVNNMSEMFYDCSALKTINFGDNFDTSSVLTMKGMFGGCGSLEQLNISGFITEKVEDMSEMFFGCNGLTALNLTNFNTQNVKDMRYMFDGCSSLIEIDLSGFDMRNVTNVAYMFGGALSDTKMTGVRTIKSPYSTGTGTIKVSLPVINNAKWYIKNNINEGSILEYELTDSSVELQLGYEILYKDMGGEDFSGTHGSGYPIAYIYGQDAELVAPSKVGYNFKGWYLDEDCTELNSVLSITSDDWSEIHSNGEIRIYAKWVACYTIIWQNYDGEELEKDENVDVGMMPEYNGEPPKRDADAQYTYTFKGWSPEISEVAGDVTYTATFTSVVNKYTVLWKNDNGDVLETDEDVSYDTMPTYDGAKPTKDADAQYTYTFKGWSPEISEVVGDVTYTAVYDSVINKYEIIWLDENREELHRDSVEYGQIPTYEGTPTKDSTAEYEYEFDGWDPEVASVTGTATYTATYKAKTRKYTITWIDENGEELEIDTGVLYGSNPSYDGEIPTKDSTAQYTYIFAGWSPEISEVAGDVTYTATFTSVFNKYTVLWKNDNGDVLETDEDVSYGTMPTYDGAIPTKDADAQYTYKFKCWDKTVGVVTGDVTYTAVYDGVINKYEIIWLDENGEELHRDSVEYGQIPTYEGTPTKDSTAEYEYEFDGWDPEVASVTGTAIYTATYKAKTREYTITWIDGDGKVVKEEQIEYGETPEYNGENPTKTPTAEWEYVFDGWNEDIVAVNGDTSYTAKFTQTKRKYTVIWKNENGTEIEKDINVPYGTMPEFNGSEPLKSATVQYTYTFNGWSPEVLEVVGDITYTATFASVVNKYKITWKNDDGTVLEVSDVEYGATPIYYGTPSKQSGDPKYMYVFEGWTTEIKTVTGDASYTAKFRLEVVKFTITIQYVLEGRVFDQKTEAVEYGGSLNVIIEDREKMLFETVKVDGEDFGKTSTLKLENIVKHITVSVYFEKEPIDLTIPIIAGSSGVALLVVVIIIAKLIKKRRINKTNKTDEMIDELVYADDNQQIENVDEIVKKVMMENLNKQSQNNTNAYQVKNETNFKTGFSDQQSTNGEITSVPTKPNANIKKPPTKPNS